ncbi:hypothetical protein FHX42_003170 [Saccharopolyspora lacisalsi]|uniref:Uncharacterized protein n=1 Tax=Halosaccharopolyspora lacisalsi TaxID=1000566 RepID=A0A839DWC2_9PSEU|nr:hypothetical protein [Halosaccharopolyspora lacisalsi]MBA8825804.1 hypothetical protein [Halosaccharopolyspora lacisalsi]
MQTYIPVFLLALAGFFLGGVYATWKTAKFLAVLLGIAGVLALGSGVMWLFG